MSYKITRNRLGNELLYDRLKWKSEWKDNYLGKITHYSTKKLTEEYYGDNLEKGIEKYNSVIDETDLILNDLENNVSEYILSIIKNIYFPPYVHFIENDDYFRIADNGIRRNYDNTNLIPFKLDYDNNKVIFIKKGFKDDFYGEKMFSYISDLSEVWFKILLNYRKKED